MGESSISAFQKELKQIPDILLMTYGESDLPPSSSIKSELISSLLSDHDHYAPTQGDPMLRKNIAKKENNLHRSTYTEDHVLITNGSTEALFLALSALLNPGDEVLIVHPDYPAYEQVVRYLQGKPTAVKSAPDFDLDIADFQKKLHAKIKAVILNYPNNPTGKTMKSETVSAVAKLLIKYKVPVILDTVYEDITFHPRETLSDIPELQPYRIIVSSLSKSQRLTGWRLGYMIAPEEMISVCTRLHQFINVCVPSFMMDAMNVALTCDPKVDYYKKNADYAVRLLKKMHLDPIEPDGGYYVTFSIRATGMDSVSFCRSLAEKYHLGLIPGIFFHMEGYVRMTVSGSYSRLVTALKRLKKAVRDGFK